MNHGLLADGADSADKTDSTDRVGERADERADRSDRADGTGSMRSTGSAHGPGDRTSGPAVIRVVGAAIIRDGRVFCAQRGAGKQVAGRWEFPGGKIEPGETPQQALVREIREELRCTVRVGARVETTDNPYSFGTVELSTYYCRLVSGTPILTEHQQARWERPEDMPSLDWAPADRPAMREIAGKTAEQLETAAR